MEASRPKGNVSTRGGSPSRLAGAAANGKTIRAKSPPATTLDPLPTTPNGKANNNKQRKSSGEPGKCELHDIADCEWCALGVKNRAMYGRLWPYAEHPVTREHYCLEPVESPTGGKYPCCSFRREKPIKTSQGYAGHLASHRAHIQGSTNTINGVGVALPLLVAMSNGGGSGGGGSAASPSSNGDQALGKKRKRESTLTGSHETVATPTMSTTVSTTSSSGGGGGGKVMPQFVASLQPSLPRCDLEAGQLRFILLPQDSEAAAIDVVFKGHRGKLSKSAAKDADGFFVIACPLIHELLPPNDTRTTFEVSVRVEDPATHRRLFQSSLLFTHHHAAAQASAAPRAESVVAGGSAPRPPARAIANGEGDYDEAEEGEEEEKEEEKEEEMMTNKEEDEEGGDGERAGEEETKNEDEKTKTKKEKRRKIEEEKSGGEEMQEEKKEEKMEAAGVEGEEPEEASESQAMELEIAEENEDDDDEEENDAEANVKKNEGEADGEDQKERRRSEVIGEAGDNGKNDATQQSPELRPDVTVKIEAMGETIADEKVDHQQKPQRELPDMLTQLAEAAAAESHSNVAPVAGRPAPSPGKANGHGHGAAVERPTMAEALHAMPMNTVSSLLPWAHMAAAAAGGHPLPPHFALPDCYALTPAAAAAAAAAIAADPHTAALMLPGLFQSYYGPGGPLPLSALLPPMPHASHMALPPPTTRPLAPMPASMMTSASPSSSAMSTSSSASAISPALTSMIKAKAPSSPPTSTTTTTTSGGAPATATPPRSSVSPPPTTPTTTSTATAAMLAQKPWLRGQLAPMAQMMTSIPPPKPPKPAKPAKPVKPPKVVKPVVKPPPPPPFVLQPAGSGPTTPPTAGTAASTSASSAPSPTVAASRPLQTLLAAAARPSGAAAGGREACRYYFYTVLPEKGKLIWVVFFSSRRHALDQYELLLHEVAPPLSASSGSLSSSIERLACSNGGGGGGLSLSLSSSASALALAMATELEPDAGDSPSPPTASTPQPPPLSPPLPELPTSGGPGQQTIVLPAVPDLAWIAEGTDASTGQRLYQHKVCFQAPDSTFERRIFCATLHQRVERTMTLLGGLSLVSTTSQREQMWSRINQWFVSEVQQRLVHNCRHHPPSRRHFLNGKGSRQGSKQAQKDRFLFDELDKSVELESVPVNSLLPPGS